MHKLFIPKQAAGANLVYFDFFNTAGSGRIVRIWSVLPIVSGAVAVTGVVGVDLFLTRTSAVGTGGTAATVEGTDPTAATFSAWDNMHPASAIGMTARLTPTGGATAGAVLSYRSLFTEETSSPPYFPVDMINNQTDTPVLVNPGTGIRVVQGAVASVGNIGFDIAFSTSQFA
jgi:hypothetical protein